MSKIRNRKYQFKRNNLSLNHGITLISLVVTIILLIILAGIGINLSIGENGLFNKAKYAKEKYLNAQVEEERALNELYEELGLLGDLPKNTPDTKAGTIVETPEKWKTTMNYISGTTGEQVKTTSKVASVYAVAVGNGKEVPVPIGFYYVGGTIESGIVISDNKDDQNKYKGKEDVPAGITLNEDKTLKYELKGNQFVWIPATEQTYKKYDWGTTYRNNIYNTDTSAGELLQIKKYKGFYVGRFEAGLDSNIAELDSRIQHTGVVQTRYNAEGTPQSKAGVIPWMFIDYTKSKKNAESMYDGKIATVQSGLVTGTMWDTMLTWMAGGNSTSTILTNNTWGNHTNTTPEINLGRKGYAFVSGRSWYQDPFDVQWSQSTEENKITKPAGTLNTNYNGKGYLLTTGASEECKLKNLYDVAGNVWEWTEEVAVATTSNGALTGHRVYRGGVATEINPVCYRNHGEVSINSFGLRVPYSALYRLNMNKRGYSSVEKFL